MATLATILDRFTAKGLEQPAPRPRTLEEDDPFVVPRFPNEDIFLYVKRINNSRVAREADPAAPRQCWRMIGVSLALAILVIGMLLPALYGLMAGYRVQSLHQEKQRLELERAGLELEETKLLSPARLEELARMQRFVDPAPESVVYLDSKSSEPILAKK